MSCEHVSYASEPADKVVYRSGLPSTKTSFRCYRSRPDKNPWGIYTVSFVRAAVFALAAVLSLGVGWAQAEDAEGAGAVPPVPEGERGSRRIFVQTVPVRPGVDRCVVCSTLLQPGDRVYLVEGQRVGIMVVMEPRLLSDPWTYIARLKPRGGLFGGEMAPASGVSDGWLLLGVYVTLGLGFAAVCGHRAINVGQGPVPWFFAGLFFNAFGYLALLLRPVNDDAAPPARYAGVTKVPSTSEPHTCPQCGHLNHPSATECLGCHTSLIPEGASEVTRVSADLN